MLFNSFEFLFFFPLVTVLFYALPHRFRWAMLLLASCLFYMAFIPKYIVILGITILIDYVAGIRIEDSTNPKGKKQWLVGSILSTCLVLFIFKYFNFFNTNFKSLADVFGLHYPVPMLNIILPIGLSFHTFQSLSYVIEVYRGQQKAERDFGIYSLYVMFYPQLVAGPIERPQNLLHQFHEYHAFSYDNVVKGLRMMLWGLFKKMVIADRISQLINPVYAHPEQFHGFEVWLAALLFGMQIYCDFSGYSDIAIGAGRTMGFHMMTNFNRPYFSKSISEFWKRWHISLGTWFRDYLYIPLGGNRVGKPRYYFNLMATFLVSGLWHGASWNFIVWGGIHGALQVVEAMTRKYRNRTGLSSQKGLLVWLQGLYVLVFTNLAWIFFRSPNFSTAGSIFRQAADLGGTRWGQFHYGTSPAQLWIALLAIAFMETIHVVERRRKLPEYLAQQKPAFRWAFYMVLLLAVAHLGIYQNTDFIYFQF